MIQGDYSMDQITLLNETVIEEMSDEEIVLRAQVGDVIALLEEQTK